MILGWVLPHKNNPERLAAEIDRVLVPGDHIVVGLESLHLDLNRLKKALHDRSLSRLTEVAALWPGHNVIHGQEGYLQHYALRHWQLLRSPYDLPPLVASGDVDP